MAMTVQQAQQLVNAQEGPVNPDSPSAGLGNGGSDYVNGLTLEQRQWLAYNGIDPTSTDDVTIALYLYKGGKGGPNELAVLKDAGLISPSDTSAELGIGPNAPTKGLQHVSIGGRLYTFDPTTGQYSLAVDASGNAIGSGASGSDHYATDVAAANELRQLEEKKREFGLTFEESQREFNLQHELAQQAQQQGFVQNRATTGLNLADLQRGLANDVYQRALDPGNYPAYLAASAGLPQGAGSPISALIGQGVQIQPPGGSNPLADPRFQGLMDQLYGYAQPQSLSTVQNIAAQHGGTLPPEFYKYTGTTPPAHASGGSQMLNGPVVGVNMTTGQPEFIAGEAGREMVTFTPMHTHETNGVPMPHQHDYGEHAHEHMGNVIQFAGGGAVIAGAGPTQHQLIAAWNAYHPDNQMADVLTPAEGTAVSAGKAIGNLGYAPQYLTDQLMEGRTPTPGSLDEATLMRLPPSIRALLQAQVRSALGGAGLMDYNAELQNQQFAGLNSGRTATYYQ